MKSKKPLSPSLIIWWEGIRMQALIATMTAKDPHRKQRMAAWAQAASNALRDQWPWHEDKEGDSSNG